MSDTGRPADAPLGADARAGASTCPRDETPRSEEPVEEDPAEDPAEEPAKEPAEEPVEEEPAEEEPVEEDPAEETAEEPSDEGQAQESGEHGSQDADGPSSPSVTADVTVQVSAGDVAGQAKAQAQDAVSDSCERVAGTSAHDRQASVGAGGAQLDASVMVDARSSGATAEPVCHDR